MGLISCYTCSIDSPTPQEQYRERALRDAQRANFDVGIEGGNGDDEGVYEGAVISDDYEEGEEEDSLVSNSLSQSPPSSRGGLPTDGLAEQLKAKYSRDVAKGASNGANATGSVGWDGFISFATTYLHMMARAVVSILSPEPSDPESASPSQKMLHTFIPPYRPLQEPGDFLYFLSLLAISAFIITVILMVILLILSIFLFPVLVPGFATS